jgi:hypothetical protein
MKFCFMRKYEQSEAFRQELYRSNGLFISPREKDIAARTRAFLPATTKLILVETEYDAPEASLDMLIRSTELFHALCEAPGVNPESQIGSSQSRFPTRAAEPARLSEKLSVHSFS